MIKRFQGKDGKKLLLESLCSQQVIHNNRPIARAIAKVCKVHSVKKNTRLIKQGASDNQIYLILAGAFSIRINGREIAVRRAGVHIGEMALIDPRARRCATVVATEESVLAEISEKTFSKLAKKHSELWRRLALEIADRLRQRSRFIQQPNNKPVIFIGSSKEKLRLAKKIKAGLPKSVSCSIWTDGIFRPSKTTIESLVEAVQQSDFAVLILDAEDTIVSRNQKRLGPRDNCVFELGLFIGALGRERVFIVRPKKNNLKIPSDLLGVTPIYYDAGSSKTLKEKGAAVCSELSIEFARLGVK